MRKKRPHLELVRSGVAANLARHRASPLFAPPMNASLRALVLLLGLSALLVGCQKQKPAPAVAPLPVKVITTAAADQVVFADFIGQTSADQTVTVTARVEGILSTVEFKDGSAVKQGDLLFTIDDRPLQAAAAQARGALAQARSSSETAQRDLERVRQLHGQGGVSDVDLDAAKMKATNTAAALLSAQAALENAELQLSFARITAPLSGLIGASAVSAGNLVGRGQGTPLATIVAVDPIRVQFSIDEGFYLEVAKGGRKGAAPTGLFELVLADGSVYAHRGDLAFIDNQVDKRTGTLKVEAVFPNPDRTLRPGLFARVRFPRQVVKDAIVVPQRAVQELLATYSVVVVTAENKAEFRPVQVGARLGSNWLIATGLKAGERVVVEGAAKLRPGMPVQVVTDR